MNSAKLISLVGQHEELYNTTHFDYSNQQRRDYIWEEIGRILNQSSTACRSHWSRLRDNHRKALSLRRARHEQTGTLMKPPKYYQELQFLLPYFTDDEETDVTRLYKKEFTPSDLIEITHIKSESSDSGDNSSFQIPFPGGSDISQITSSNDVKPRRKRTSDSPLMHITTDPDISYLETTLDRHHQSAASLQDNNDPLKDFFMNMCQTVKTFPLQHQIYIKKQLFNLVNGIEMALATDGGRVDFIPPAYLQDSSSVTMKDLTKHLKAGEE